jgi:phage shock protein A
LRKHLRDLGAQLGDFDLPGREQLVAKSAFFVRLTNLWSGFLSLWVSDLEKDHPEIAYENSINSMLEKYAALKKATAAIIRRREDLQERLGRTTKEFEQVSADLETAVETGEDDLALVLISKKNALESELNDLQTDLVQAEQDGEDAKESLLNVQAEIGKLREEKDRMLAKMASAKARITIQGQLDGLSVDAEVKALENVRANIHNLAAQAKLNQELQGQSLEGRLAAVRRQTGDVSAKKQLEELKAKRLAANAQKAGQKTI